MKKRNWTVLPPWGWQRGTGPCYLEDDEEGLDRVTLMMLKRDWIVLPWGWRRGTGSCYLKDVKGGTGSRYLEDDKEELDRVSLSMTKRNWIMCYLEDDEEGLDRVILRMKNRNWIVLPWGWQRGTGSCYLEDEEEELDSVTLKMKKRNWITCYLEDDEEGLDRVILRMTRGNWIVLPWGWQWGTGSCTLRMKGELNWGWQRGIGLCYLKNDEEGLDGVAEDDTPEELPLLEAVPVVVDDLHLLDDGGLAWLPRPQQQQLDLPVHLAAAASCLMTGSFLAQVVAARGGGAAWSFSDV